MIDKMFVIVSKDHGSLDVCTCTVANAMDIFDNFKEALSATVIDIANSWNEGSTVQYISYKSILDTISEIFNLDIGEVAVKYSRVVLGKRDAAEYVHLTDEMKSELALWMFKHKYSTDRINSFSLQKLTDDKFWELSLFKPLFDRIAATNKTVKFYDYPDEYETARQYRVITESRWKEGISEDRKVTYILNFVNEVLVDRSDQEYDVCELKDIWG